MLENRRGGGFSDTDRSYGDETTSRGAAVEQLLGEFGQLHPRMLSVGQHRVDPWPRPAYRGDPVQSVLAAEYRERARAAGQPDDAI